MGSFRLSFQKFGVCMLSAHKAASSPFDKCRPLVKWLWSFCQCRGRFRSIYNRSTSYCFQVQLVTWWDLFVYHLRNFGVCMLSAHKAASRRFDKCRPLVKLLWSLCQWRGKIWSTIGQDPSVSKSNWLHDGILSGLIWRILVFLCCLHTKQRQDHSISADLLWIGWSLCRCWGRV